MKKFVVAAALSLTLTAAFAQTPAVDPAAAQAVKELLVTMKFREMMTKSFNQMAATMPQMMLQQTAAMINADKSLSDAKKKEELAKAEKRAPALAAELAELFGDKSFIEDMEKEMVPLYARHFNAAEIKQIADFYKTAAGAKMMEKMPAIMNESMMIGQRLATPRVQKLMEKYKPNGK